MSSVVMTVVTEMIDTIPKLCAENITAEICRFIHDDFSVDIRDKIAKNIESSYVGSVTLETDKLVALLARVAPEYKAVTGGSTRKQSRSGSGGKRPLGRTATRRVSGGTGGAGPNKAGLEKSTSSKMGGPAGSLLGLSGALASLQSKSQGQGQGQEQHIGASISSVSGASQVLERALTEAVSKIADPVLAKVKTDLVKLFDEDKDKVTAMVREGFDRLFDRIARDPKTMAVFREKAGVRIDAMLQATPDPVFRAVVVANKCPVQILTQVQTQMDMYAALRDSTSPQSAATSASIVSDMEAVREKINAFLHTLPTPTP